MPYSIDDPLNLVTAKSRARKSNLNNFLRPRLSFHQIQTLASGSVLLLWDI